MTTRLASIHAASLACACAFVLASCSDPSAAPGAEAARSAQALGEAAFEPSLGAPGCIDPYQVRSGCSSGILLAGPDAAGPEFHSPNTLGTACMERGDMYLSVQAIEVASPDGAPMAAGQPLDVQVTVAGSSGGYVQLWYAPDAFAPVWQPIHERFVDLGGGSEATIATTIVLAPAAVQAIRAGIGPAGEAGCAGQTDTDDLAFAVGPAPDPSPFFASPRNGAVVTGDVVLAIGDPGFPVAHVDYFTDEGVVSSEEPPSFRAVWPTTLRTEPGPATVYAYAYGAEGQFRGSTVTVTVATSAACDLAGGNPVCFARTAACGSDRGTQGASGVETCGWEPWITCAGRRDDGTVPFIDHLVVRSRDGSALAPRVDARVDVDLGGPIDGTLPGLALDVYLLDPNQGTWTLLETMPVADPSRRSIGFRVPVPNWRFDDPLSLRFVRAVLRDGGGPFTCDSSVLDDDVLGFASPDTVPPAVALLTPEDGAVVVPTGVWLMAAARDAGVIDHVTFLMDDAPVTEAWSPPYQVLIGLPPGPHRLAAEAWDRNGNRAATPDVSVTVDGAPPVVALTAPSPDATVHGVVDVSVDASDDARVVGVQLELDGALIGAAEAPPWTFAWDTTRTARGTHWLRATAIDAAGARTSTPDLPVVVDQLPVVQLVSPVDGEELYAPAPLSAVATDDGAVARVEFLVDGAPVATLYAPPYEIVWTPPALGTYRVAARACDAPGGFPLLAAAGDAGDGQCATTSEAQIRFVQLVPVDTKAPVVALTAPQRGASVTGVVTLEASASDDVGVTVVSFYVNGSVVGGDASAPWSVTWDSTPYQGQSVNLAAVAADAAGNVGTSAGVTVLVPDVTAPEVAITSPIAGAALFKSAELQVATRDNVGVARVEYYADGALIGTASQPPFDLAWNVRKIERAPHTLVARAIDAAGNAGSSAGVRVFVK